MRRTGSTAIISIAASCSPAFIKPISAVSEVPARPATIELAQAIQTAQNAVKGSVLEAELDSKRGMLFYKVEILAANHMQHKVIVDALNGKVLESYIDYDD